MSVTADTFLRHLHDALPEDWSWGHPGEDPEVWKWWIHASLHRVAAKLELSCCCASDRHGHDHDPLHRSPRGYQATYLYDLTWYKAWHTWELPCAAVQISGMARFDAFLESTWKLQFSAAPLRVSVGRTSTATDVHTWVALLEGVRSEAGWTPPPGEDVILLAHDDMAPRNIRVLRRDDAWVDHGPLAGLIG